MRLINGVVLVAVAICLLGCNINFAASSVSLPKASSVAPEGAGRLAYVGADGNVYITNADRTSKVAVTDNATAPFEAPGLSYQRISWSQDNQLAYAAVTRSNEKTTSKLYVLETSGKTPQLVGQSSDHFVIYIYWSPVPCPERPKCRRLAYLIEEDGNIALRLVEINGDNVENQRIGIGWPYYFSWASHGESILWHINGTHRFDENAQIALYNLVEQDSRPFPYEPASFMAPAWSPTEELWLGVSSDTVSDQLQIFGQETPNTLADVPKGGAAFVWSPSGDQVAYALRENSTDPFFGPIYVYDVDTGKSTQITDVGLHPVAFFWDPAGQRIGYLTRLSMPGTSWMQWRVYDLGQNLDRGFKAFNPSLHMRYIMSSFNQYAQSHRFWSPDGRYLVYGEQDDARRDQVWLIDTWSEDGLNSILVDSGTMGFWSWN